MSCYHPLYGWRFRNGIEKKFHVVSSEEPSSLYLFQHPEQEWTQMPCGKCVGCRLQYSRDWADRCVLESMEWSDNAFLTLTYDDEHLVYGTSINKETGEVCKVPTLVPEHLTKFLKDLRRYYEYHYNLKNIRFYACGEYGSQTNRPHFHIIAFNLPIFDKKYLFTNENYDRIYLSDEIAKIWNRGIVSVGDVTWNSAAYVARYIMKKVKGPNSKEYYSDLGIVPEFTRSSRRPGIAYKYYENNRDKIYNTDEILLSVKGRTKVIKPVKYFDKLYDLDSPEAMKAIKEQRKSSANNSMKLVLEKTSLNKVEYLSVKERDKIYQISSLKRNLKNI